MPTGIGQRARAIVSPHHLGDELTGLSAVLLGNLDSDIHGVDGSLAADTRLGLNAKLL